MKLFQNKWFLLFILSLVWGSSFILIRKSLDSFSFMQVGALRVFYASVILLPIAIRNFNKIPKNLLKWVVLSAILGNFLPLFLFPLAETHVNSSIAGILNSLVPLFVIVLGSLFFSIRYKPLQILGVFIGFLGCILLIGFKDYTGAMNAEGVQNAISQLIGGNNQLHYIFYIIIATLCYAINVLLVKKKLVQIPSLALSSTVFAVLLIPSLIILICSGFLEIPINHIFWEGVIYVGILGVLGTAIATILFYRLLQISSTVFATSVTYLMPLVAIFWGFLFNEPISIYILLGAFLVLLGVYLTKER